MLVMVACDKQDNEAKNLPQLPDEVFVDSDYIKEEPEPEPEAEAEPETQEDKEKEDEKVDAYTGLYSPITGLPIGDDLAKQRPVAVMLDNHYAARWQAGLSDADVVYEVLAEGLITRYLAIFQSHVPDVIGPVRSARPYYIQLALSYNPLYVHVGGSDQAFLDIKRLKMADIDGMKAGYDVYYRTDHKYIPHNMYTSYTGISKEASRRGYLEEVSYEGMFIDVTHHPISGDPGQYLKVIYKPSSSSDPTGYFIEFKYDEDKQQYMRYVNGQAHKDETTEIHLAADNVVVLHAKHTVLDSAGRRAVDIVGQGKGYYLNRGVSMPITWSKAGGYEVTKYYDMNGEELKLNPGKTWIQVISDSTTPIID